MPAKNTDNSASKELHRHAYSEAQKWLESLCQKKLAQYDDEGIAHVNESVAARFSLGLHEENIFIAMRREESDWAEGMQWEYAAIYRGKKNLYFVASPVEMEFGISAPFGLSFQLSSVSEAASLAAYESIQMRRFAKGIDYFQKSMVSRFPFAEIPVLILEENQSIFDVNSKPKSKFDSRSSK